MAAGEISEEDAPAIEKVVDRLTARIEAERAEIAHKMRVLGPRQEPPPPDPMTLRMRAIHEAKAVERQRWLAEHPGKKLSDPECVNDPCWVTAS
jgi:hypothetical protein